MAMAVEEAKKLEAAGYSKEDAKNQAMQKLLEGVEELSEATEEMSEEEPESPKEEDCEEGVQPVSEEEPAHKPFFTSPPKKKVVVIAKIKK